MPDPANAPENPLRDAYWRARELPLNGQLVEAANQLSHPEVLAADIVASFQATSEWLGERELPQLEPADLDAVDLEELGRETFYSTREVAVVSQPNAFTCVASNIDPLAGLRPDTGDREGLDFLGLSCDASRTPVLGAVQSERDNSAYLLFLRGLASLVELSTPRQLARMSQAYFLGKLADPPAFDLDLVVWDLPCPGDEVTVLEQLTRDLAEAVLGVLRRELDNAGVLRHIVCLRMNPERFEGRLHFFWRV